jgi:DNA mismatch endonuclease (patch repair protein)
MAAVRSTGTEPERQLRRAARGLGRRFRVCVADIPGRPDVVFPAEQVAVFVDGDFWHGRQWRLRGHSSLESQFARSHNRAYWVEKITRNARRDRQTTRRLRKLGWHVVRLWESDLRARPERCIKRVRVALERAS